MHVWYEKSDESNVIINVLQMLNSIIIYTYNFLTYDKQQMLCDLLGSAVTL